MASRIVQGNPEVFTGALALDTICLVVNKSWQKIEARTEPESKTIFFSPSLLTVLQDDDELTAVLSHELAHLTLQHQGFGDFPPRMFSDSVFAELFAKSKQVQTEIIALARSGAASVEIFKRNEKYAQLLTAMNARVDDVYGELNAHVSWFEEEADDVGAEFFLRAGFRKEAYLSALWKTSEASGEERTECEARILSALNQPTTERPKRGVKVHPLTCWRAFHLAVDESAKAHSSEAVFFQNTSYSDQQ